MGFLDNVKGITESVAKNVSTMGNTVAIKAKEKSTIFKLKKEIEENEKDIRKTLVALGEMVLNEYDKVAIMDEDKIAELCKSIHDKERKINELNIEISKAEIDAEDDISDLKAK